MRPNGNQANNGDASARQSRVTSMARWLSRRRGAQAAPAPKLSVVIPVYNAESTLKECLTKLHESRYRDFETILVDDGCTDHSPAIAAEFPVRIVPTSGRVGPAAARNLGARMATGEVLFFIDSDVMVRPDTLASSRSRSKPATSTACAGCRLRRCGTRTSPASTKTSGCAGPT
jgi:GT2 family glycosyltransferase